MTTKRKTSKKPAAKKKTGPKPVIANMLDSHEADILEAIRTGMGYRALAAKYGASLGSFGMWVNANLERSCACARAREESADECDEAAAIAIAEAGDPFELSKARELAIHYRWRAKARNPDRYGDRVKTEHSGEIGIRTLAAKMRERVGKA